VNLSPDSSQLYEELCQLADLGSRFHGTSGEDAGAEFIHERLSRLGLDVEAHEVRTRAWRPRGESKLQVTSPRTVDIECWPLLWTAGSHGALEGSAEAQGAQGFWDNSFVWTKFAVLRNGMPAAYISARDDGPAAPQPLPAGSIVEIPHLAIGHLDGMRINEWLDVGIYVRVRVDVPAEHGNSAVGHNLEVALPGTGSGGETVVCAHYDTFFNTVGAYDNGSGTLALLELARRWTARPPRRSVRMVFFAAEEWHLAGSRAFVSSLSAAERSGIDFVLNLDGLGRGDLLECSVGPEEFEYAVGAALRNFGTNRKLTVASRFPPLMGTDHAPFYAAGIPSAHLTFNDWHLLHRPEDLPTRGSASNIAWTVSAVEHLIDVLERPGRAPLHDIL